VTAAPRLPRSPALRHLFPLGLALLLGCPTPDGGFSRGGADDDDSVDPADDDDTAEPDPEFTAQALNVGTDEPAPGVTVAELGAAEANEVTTDAEGRFSITPTGDDPSEFVATGAGFVPSHTRLTWPQFAVSDHLVLLFDAATLEGFHQESLGSAWDETAGTLILEVDAVAGSPVTVTVAEAASLPWVFPTDDTSVQANVVNGASDLPWAVYPGLPPGLVSIEFEAQDGSNCVGPSYIELVAGAVSRVLIYCDDT